MAAGRTTIRETVLPTNAIQAPLTMKVLFGVALRQTAGFVESLLLGLDRAVPDSSSLSRRQSEMGPKPEGNRLLLHLVRPP